MRKCYRVWDYPEASIEEKGSRVEHKSVRANITTVMGAKRIFCAITGRNAKDLEDDTETWEYEQVEFYHKELGYVGGIGI